MREVLNALLPWEFSPTALIGALAALIAYLRGWRRVGRRAGVLRPAAFLAGVLLPYAFLDTHLEFYALHLFWLQRIDHLVLHHLAPFLIALAAPLPLLEQGTPLWVRERLLRPILTGRALLALYRFLQQPVLASVMFVGLIYLWLIPSVMLDTMLSRTDYGIMNASMLIDGILFWWLMVGPEDPQREVRVSFGARMIILVAITIPQSLLGAFITFHRSILYPSFDICGRIGSIRPLVDQELGGLNTWVLPGMMSVAGLAVVTSRAMRESPRLNARPGAPAPRSRPAASPHAAGSPGWNPEIDDPAADGTALHRALPRMSPR